MNNYTFANSGKEYKRINKSAARAAYMAGKTVYVQACNLRPWSMWGYPAAFSRKQAEQFAIDETGVRNYFNSSISSFEYYNCISTQTGRYAAFYLET